MNIAGRISSRQNALVMRATSLAEKKYRDSMGCFLIEGEKLFAEAVRAGIVPEEIYVKESKSEDILSLIEKETADIPFDSPKIFLLADACFDKISTEKSPEGIILLVRHLDFFEKYIKIDGSNFFAEDEHLLVLYDVRDPGNMGAILRSALAFGVQTVLLAGHCVDLYNPKTVRASMGALFRLRFGEAEDFCLLADALRRGGRRLLAAELTQNAKPLQTLSVTKKDVFVIGNEGHGIPRDVSALCDGSAYIPINPSVESLNAAVAASVLLYEQSRASV